MYFDVCVYIRASVNKCNKKNFIYYISFTYEIQLTRQESGSLLPVIEIFASYRIDHQYRLLPKGRSLWEKSSSASDEDKAIQAFYITFLEAFCCINEK